MTLSAQHLHIITDTLGDEQNTLEAIVANLRQSIPNKAEHFDLCSALYVLLSDNLLISPLQKVVALYVVAALNSSPLVSNPFFPAFAAVLEHAGSEDWELTYTASFIDGLPKEFLNKTASQAYEWSMTTPMPTFDVESLVTAYEASFPQPDPYTATGLSNTVHLVDPAQSRSEHVLRLMSERLQMNYFTMDTLKPNLLRPRPPLLEPSRDEVIWINPSIPIAPSSSCTTQSIWFEWDMMMGRLPPNDFSEAVELLNFAFTSTLSREQLGKLITELQGTPELLRDSHFTPQALGQLIEMNSQVAIQALVELMQCFDAQITLSSGASYKTDEYLMVINNSTPTKNSMEVLSVVAHEIQLPEEYLHLFISNCITWCKDTKDPIEQTRCVSMVCIFLNTLVRWKSLVVADVFVELESFCVTYSRVTAAANLYRLLKQMH